MIAISNAQLAVGQGPPAGSHLWSKRFGDTNVDEGRALAVDASGSVVVTGKFEGTVNFGGGPLTSAGLTDMFLAKYSGTDGAHLWSKRFGSTQSDDGEGLAIDGAGNVVVTGRFQGTGDFGGGPMTSVGQSDILLAKYSGTDGSHIWSKRLGSTGDDQGKAVAVDAAGDILVAGYFSGTVDFGGGPLTSASARDNFVAKFSGADGSHLWSKGLGGAGGFPEWAVAVDASGNVVVTGAFQGTVDFGGGALTSAGADDIFVAKFRGTNGVHLWSKRFGGTDYDDGKGVAIDGSGNVVVTGPFNGTVNFGGGPLTSAGLTDMFLVKLSGADGTHLWSKRFGGTGWDDGHKLATDSSGNVLVTSFFQGTVDFGGGPLVGAGNDDVFVAKFSGADGAHLWSKGFVSASGKGRSLMSDTSGNVVATGYFSGTVDFGGGPLTSTGGFDVFVIKLSGGAAAPAVSVSPPSHDFGNLLVGTSSAATSVTLTNSGAATLNISSITLTGTDAAQFGLTHTCAANLAAGASCILNATFSPTSAGTKSASIAIVSDASGSPHSVALAGTGVVPAPGVALQPTSINFGDRFINTTSAAQTVTLTNSGTATLNITSIDLTGVGSSQFAQANNCGATLAVSASCNISITFSPTSAGAKSAAASITSDAAGSPHTVSLTGNGTMPAPAVTLAPTSLSFGNQLINTTSATQTVTLTNSGTATLNITGVVLSGTDSSQFALTNGCGATLAVSANCTISVAFAPITSGAKSAAVTITSDAAGSPHNVPLTGNAIAPPVVSLSPSSLTFSAQIVNTSSTAQTITLTNTGGSTLSITSLSVTGADAADFTRTDNCGASLNAGASCTISVTFRPDSTGTCTAAVTIQHNAAGAPTTVGLSGMGTDFSVAMGSGSPSTATVAAGQTAAYQLSLAGTTGFSGTVSFACSGAPTAATCNVSPTSATLSGTTPVAITVTIATTARSWLPPFRAPGQPILLPFLVALLLMAFLWEMSKQKPRSARMLPSTAALAGMLFLAGCGGGGGSSSPPPVPRGTPAGTYAITVTASTQQGTQAVSRTMNLTLVVQ